MISYRRAKIVSTTTRNGTVLHAEDIGPAPMREIMARALYQCADARDVAKFGISAKWTPFDQWGGQDHWYALADAALDALMQPTPAMIEAVDAFQHEGRCPTCGGGLSEWQAMLQAAKDGK